MLQPPFKLATPAWAEPVQDGAAASDACCPRAEENGLRLTGRARLTDLNPHLHCSIIGTCLSTAELRKVLARHLEVTGLSDLELHHQAVNMAADGGTVAKAMHKALEQRHDAAVQRFGRVRTADELLALWEASVQEGDVPGAYWALLTHRHVTPELKQRAFGDVHMLSHLVGAANRADIRRLVALEQANAELRESLEQGQQRAQMQLAERDQALARLQQEHIELRGQFEQARSRLSSGASPQRVIDDALLAVQSQRREQAERQAGMAQAEAAQAREDLQQLRVHMRSLEAELAAAEAQLRDIVLAQEQAPATELQPYLQGRRLLYVGGRPSSTPAIRNLVLRYGGEFQHHDGGLEDRKGLLAAAIAGADLVVFPVDCVDHDSAGNLKRLCQRQGIAYLPVRRASVASFIQAVTDAGRDLQRRHDPAHPVNQAIGDFIQNAMRSAAGQLRPSGG